MSFLSAIGRMGPSTTRPAPAIGTFIRWAGTYGGRIAAFSETLAL
jgi:hypothetical protein